MNQPTKAHVEYDPARMGVKIAVVRPNHYLTWTPHGVEARHEAHDAGLEPQDDVWLRLQEDDARAVYEALADYFGHVGHDARALRRDYDAERTRVDKMLEALIRGTPRG